MNSLAPALGSSASGDDVGRQFPWDRGGGLARACCAAETLRLTPWRKEPLSGYLNKGGKLCIIGVDKCIMLDPCSV